MTPALRIVVGIAAFYGLLVLYVTPSLIAARRANPRLAVVLRRNVLLGWTGVVWIGCLVVALRRPPARTVRPVTLASDRMPTWVADLPRVAGPWAALPRDTRPLDPGCPS